MRFNGTRSVVACFAAVLWVFFCVGMPGVGYAIINGVPDEGAHPYVGLVVFDVDYGSGVVPGWRCSGFLVAPDVLVTAGHCTDGAVGARVWFEEDVDTASDYPAGGGESYEGFPVTHPDYCLDCGHGKLDYLQRNAGVVLLDEPVFLDRYADLPALGLVDSLATRTALTVVGYGLQYQLYGGGPPVWTSDGRVRLAASIELIASQFVTSDELIRTTQNPADEKGGACYGDSGGPDLLEGTDTAVAIDTLANNDNCAGVSYSTRLDAPAILDWIRAFLP